MVADISQHSSLHINTPSPCLIFTRLAEDAVVSIAEERVVHSKSPPIVLVMIFLPHPRFLIIFIIEHQTEHLTKAEY
jgi:hypothetical protein